MTDEKFCFGKTIIKDDSSWEDLVQLECDCIQSLFVDGHYDIAIQCVDILKSMIERVKEEEEIDG